MQNACLPSNHGLKKLLENHWSARRFESWVLGVFKVSSELGPLKPGKNAKTRWNDAAEETTGDPIQKLERDTFYQMERKSRREWAMKSIEILLPISFPHYHDILFLRKPSKQNQVHPSSIIHHPSWTWTVNNAKLQFHKIRLGDIFFSTWICSQNTRNHMPINS